MCTNVLRKKFRGCLLGTLVGDCLGAPYEGETISYEQKDIIKTYLDKMESSFKCPLKNYTDDTAMTKSVAAYLINNPSNYEYLAKLFVIEYTNEPNRGYGQGAINILKKLRDSKFQDIFKPAQEQFAGSGSYGNGGAMRIAPVALYYYNDYNTMIDVATNATKITHNHILGINGALLQCIAVHQALLMNPKDSIKPKEFCDELIKKIKNIEDTPIEKDDLKSDLTTTAYQEKLCRILSLLDSNSDEDELHDEILYSLGNGIEAHNSVPTAIYCFLRAVQDSTLETNKIMRRTIQNAISLGGDTDTIAGMAGAIAGAFVGEGQFDNLVRYCEYAAGITKLADNLYEEACKVFGNNTSNCDNLS